MLKFLDHTCSAFSACLEISFQEWKYEGALFNPVAPGCSPEAKWCGGGYDEQVPYYQLVVKVPPTTKGVVMKQLIYNKDSKDITVEAVDVSGVDPVCGEYECSQYIDKGKGNDWHYVTVTKSDGEDAYKWSNRAGKSWTLDLKTLDIDESCPYYDSGRHNEPQRNAQNIVTSMIFGGEAYNRVDVDVKNPEFAEAKKLWWPGEAQNLKDLSDGNKLLLLPLKMMEYDQKTGELQAFVKSCKFEVLTDSDCNLAELNKMPTVAERGGGRGIALAMQNREWVARFFDLSSWSRLFNTWWSINMNHANWESGNPEKESGRETFQLAQRTAPSLVLPRRSRDRIDALQRAERQKENVFFHRRFSLFRKPTK